MFVIWEVVLSPACRVENPSFDAGYEELNTATSPNENTSSSSDQSALSTTKDSTPVDPPTANQDTRTSSTTSSTQIDTLSVPTTTSSEVLSSNTTPSTSHPLESTSSFSETSTASSSTSSSVTSSSDSSTQGPSGPAKECPAGVYACFFFDDAVSDRARDERGGAHLQLSDTTHHRDPAQAGTLLEHYLTLGSNGKGETATIGWPNTDNGIGMDVWFRPQSCGNQKCIVAGMLNYFALKVDPNGDVTCETLIFGKIYETPPHRIALGSSKFIHAGCSYASNSLTLYVDQQTPNSRSINLGWPNSTRHGIGNETIPQSEDPLTGDIASARYWNNANAMRSVF